MTDEGRRTADKEDVHHLSEQSERASVIRRPSPLILIVEDNANNRTMVRDILRFYKYEVLEAENGEQGIKLAEEQSPDLVLMDIHMPVMDGLTAIKRLKNNKDTRDLKVIAMTSFPLRYNSDRIKQAGFDDYISKPIKTRELPKLVERMLAAE